MCRSQRGQATLPHSETWDSGIGLAGTSTHRCRAGPAILRFSVFGLDGGSHPYSETEESGIGLEVPLARDAVSPRSRAVLSISSCLRDLRDLRVSSSPSGCESKLAPALALVDARPA